MKNKITALTLALATAPLLVACGGEDPASTAAPATDNVVADKALAKVDLDRVADMFRFTDYRYVEFDETKELADTSVTDAGLTGQIVGFETGPKLYPDGGAASGTTMIMKVTVSEVVDGATPSARQVSVLLPASAEQTVADFAEAMPSGTELVLYLAEAVDLPPDSPPGLMTPVSPQGFVVGASGPTDDGIVYPLAHEVVQNESLVEQLPEG